MFQTNQQCFEVLGIPSDSTPEAIKQAYRKLSLATHPDRNPADKEAEEKFKRVQSAYEHLTSGGHEEQPDGFDPFSFFSGFGFDHQRDINMPQVVEVSLTWMQAFQGCEMEVSVPIGSCEACKGNGAKDGKTVKCGACHGRGSQVMRHGNMMVQTPCRECRGQGAKREGTCDVCSGSGQGKPVTAKLKVPPHTQDGMRAKAKGIIFLYRVFQHDYFRWHGQNVLVRVPVSAAQAAVGGEVKVLTPWGWTKTTVPPGLNEHMVLTVESPDGQNVLVHFQIVTHVRPEVEETYRQVLKVEQEFPPPIVSAYLETVVQPVTH